MNKRVAWRLVRRVFIRFALIACFALVRREPAASAAATFCDQTPAYDCLAREGKWSHACCLCADFSVVYACESDGNHDYNVCTGQCEVVQ
jgi:hypothetical protein